jgi:hypothetical protein
MTDQPLPSIAPLQIHKPCPKIWDELVGDGKKRFCSECCLHVHNAAQLTQREARTLVSGASSRVCMRIEYDSAGSPIFRDSPELASNAPTPRPAAARLARWALSAAAGLLAACHGSLSTPVTSDPTAGQNGVEPASKMGKVISTRMGDVATPLPPRPATLGEAVVPVNPTQPPTPDNPPVHDDK